VKTFSAPVTAQIAAGKISWRVAIKFILPSGSYGFITGYRGQVTVSSVLYVGSGGLIEVSDPDADVTGEARDLTVQLASHKIINGSLVQLFDPHVLASIESQAWFRAPAVIYRMWIGANREVIDAEQLHVRQIFSIEHRGGKSGRRIVGTLSTPAAFARMVEAKKNGPDLQKQIDATDTGYNDVLEAMRDPVYWGRATPKPLT
jgi:hypothetical protein